MYSRDSFILPDRRDVVAPCPEVLPHEVPGPARKLPSDVDRTLPLDIPDHLRNRVLRRNRHQHVDVIRQQMPFLHPTLPLLGQTPKHVPQVVPQAAIQGLAALLRDENDVILTLPFRVV